MIGRKSAVSGGQRGQSIAEFAIVAMVSLTLMFGIIQASLALYAFNFVSYGARAGLRYAMVHGSQSGSVATSASVQTYVRGLAIALNTSSLTVTTVWTPNENPGSTINVNVTYAFIPFIPLVWSQTLQMSSTAQGLVSN